MNYVDYLERFILPYADSRGKIKTIYNGGNYNIQLKGYANNQSMYPVFKGKDHYYLCRQHNNYELDFSEKIEPVDIFLMVEPYEIGESILGNGHFGIDKNFNVHGSFMLSSIVPVISNHNHMVIREENIKKFKAAL